MLFCILFCVVFFLSWIFQCLSFNKSASVTVSKTTSFTVTSQRVVNAIYSMEIVQRNVLLTNIKTSTMLCYRVLSHHKYFLPFFFCNCIVYWPVVLNVAPDTRHNPPRPSRSRRTPPMITHNEIANRETWCDPSADPHPLGRLLILNLHLNLFFTCPVVTLFGCCAIPVRIPRDDANEPSWVRWRRLSNPVSRKNWNLF